jgi:hypothetical protein
MQRIWRKRWKRTGLDAPPTVHHPLPKKKVPPLLHCDFSVHEEYRFIDAHAKACGDELPLGFLL